MASISISPSSTAWNVLWLDCASNNLYRSLSSDARGSLGSIDRVHSFIDFESALEGHSFVALHDTGEVRMTSKRSTLVIVARFPDYTTDETSCSSAESVSKVDEIMRAVFERLENPEFKEDNPSQFWISVESYERLSGHNKLKFNWVIPDFNSSAFLNVFKRTLSCLIKNVLDCSKGGGVKGDDSFTEAEGVTKNKIGLVSSSFAEMTSADTTFASSSPGIAYSSMSGEREIITLGPFLQRPLYERGREISRGSSKDLGRGSSFGSAIEVRSPLAVTSSSSRVESTFRSIPSKAVAITKKKNILLLEDAFTIARVALALLGRIVSPFWVEKSEEALKALMGEPFKAFNPLTKAHERMEPQVFSAALIDFDLLTSGKDLQGPALAARVREYEKTRKIAGVAIAPLPLFTFTSHYESAAMTLSPSHATIFNGIVSKPLMSQQIWEVMSVLFKDEIDQALMLETEFGEERKETLAGAAVQ